MTNPVSDPAFIALRGMLISERKKAGLTQSELANKLGKVQTYISKYELGERRIDVLELIKICNALGININDVINDIVLLIEEGS